MLNWIVKYFLIRQHQLCIFANTDSGGLESPYTTCNLNFKGGFIFTEMGINTFQNSPPSCNHFSPHGEWNTHFASKISTKVANWWPKDLKKIKGKNFNDICNHVEINYKALSYHSDATWERALYNSWLLIFSKHYDNIKMFSSAFLSQKLSMVNLLILGHFQTKNKQIYFLYSI